MATCLHLYKKSTLPPLLDRYLPVNSRNQNGPNLQTIETDDKRRPRNNKHVLSDEDKDELIQRSLQEKRYLETYENMYKLKKLLSKRYRTLLNEKVRKQRIQIKMSDLRGQQLLKQKTKKCISSPRVPFCSLSHDAKYLESMPHSKSYLIIGLQNELSKLGILKNQQDNENFWKLIQAGIDGSKLKEKLPDIKAKMLATKSLPLSTSARTSPVQPVDGFKNSSSLKKSTDSLLPSVDTCQSPAYHMRKQLLLSWLSEVQKRLGEPSRTQQKKTCKQNGKYEQQLHSLHHMHYFSLLNMALSRRLLEQNGQFTDVRTQQSVHDLMNYLYPNFHQRSGTNQSNRLIEENLVPSLVSRNLQEMHCKDSTKILRISKENKKMLKQHKDRSVLEIFPERVETQDISTFAQHEMVTVPLTLGDVALYAQVVETTPLNTYWTNYIDSDSVINSKKQ
ncbi:uncharacterized protein LOC117043923 isoform X2 [Lacerta agilis]|uniref:uncharacterized protein LOC117043923 isoform X2 n=1 Tax=Lacerta agilis TaxID=80427 RepID=UPI0014195CC2|nr:uncharacterized protein LOC117043923 isoform X2 [Lacerta agilis]